MKPDTKIWLKVPPSFCPDSAARNSFKRLKFVDRQDNKRALAIIADIGFHQVAALGKPSAVEHVHRYLHLVPIFIAWMYRCVAMTI